MRGYIAWLYPFLCGLIFAQAINIPFFSSWKKPTTTTTAIPPPYQQIRDHRIINADHGGGGVPLLQPTYAVGNVPWISGTKDQYIRDQLVILHPDSHLNREAWKESGYLNPDFDPSSRKSNNASSPLTTTPKPISNPSKLSSHNQFRARKLHRRPKQHQQQEHYVQNPQPVNGQSSSSSTPEVEPTNINTITNPNNFFQLQPSTAGSPSGGLYDIPAPILYRDINGEFHHHQNDPSSGFPTIASAEPMLIHGNNLLIPITAPNGFPYQQRATIHQQSLPPEAMIQFLKSPEQEISPLTRPQVKLPFPLSRDCSASNGGGSGSKPLQFVVLPIVEPVAPLKPIFPKPSFLSSQYGQFPYIPPFNLFKQPPSQEASNNNAGGGSGQFVPILNRPAPPLPFVFVQSLPLDLIGQNVEMDVIHSAAPTTTSENTVKEIPIAAPTTKGTQPPLTRTPSPSPVQPSPTPTTLVENLPHPTRPLPLIVIEKVKTPGQPPSSPVAPAAAVVEITKQTIQKSNNNGPNTPLSTISVVQPITAPGIKPTRQQQQEMQKAIEKLVPVAAAVLENVEQEQLKQQKEQGRDRDISSNIPEVTSEPVHKEEGSRPVPVVVSPTHVVEVEQQTAAANDRERAPLRPPLRPQNIQESVVGGIPPISTNTNQNFQYKRPDISSSEEIGVGPTTLSEVEVTEV